MSKTLAERAIAAYEADEQAQELEMEATRIRELAAAVDALGLRARGFGVEFDPDDVEVEGFGVSRRYSVSVPLDDDADLRFYWESRGEVVVSVRPSDQLYWDLPPGETEKGPGGGAYGCYGLSPRTVTTLEEVGAEVLKVRAARERWTAKHEGRNE